MDLYSIIFKEVYGFPIEELDETEGKRIRDAVKRLRSSYQSNIPITDYQDESIRKAYMLCYYIHYTNPAYSIANEFLLKPLKLQNKNKYIISYLGAGPAPEVYGSLKALSETRWNARLEINILDLEKAWLNERQITYKLIKDLKIKLSPINNVSGCDLKLDCRRNCLSFKECRETVLNSDVLFLQNTINHLGNDSYFIESLKQKIEYLKDEALFVIIDLDYAIVKETIQQLIDHSAGFAKLIASNINNNASEFLSNEPVPAQMSNLIFTGESGLIVKKKTRCYYAILQICRGVQQ